MRRQWDDAMKTGDPDNPDTSLMLIALAMILSSIAVAFSFFLIMQIGSKNDVDARKDPFCNFTFGHADANPCRVRAWKN